MDWKVERGRRSDRMDEKQPLFTSQGQCSSSSQFIKKMKNRSRFRMIISVLVICQLMSPCHCFFFPKSLFRRLSSPGPATPTSSRDAQIAAIYQQDASQQNPNFHVPKALCLACEKFPWTPMSLSLGGHVDQSIQHDQQASDVQPSKTIVIKALGQDKDPINLPPGVASRKPFAIQFDPSQQNHLAAATQQKPQYVQQTVSETSMDTNPSTRPITFQIYDPPKEPTVLKPVNNQVPVNQQPPPPSVSQPQQQPQQSFQRGYPNEPAAFMQPPHTVQLQYQVPLQKPVPLMLQQQVSYGRPTVLQPVQSYGMVPPPPLPQQSQVQQPQQVYGFPPFRMQHQNNIMAPIPPITISTIVASQHGRAPKQPVVEFNGIQPAKLVYQEHSEIHPPSVASYRQPQQQYGKPSFPQGFKIMNMLPFKFSKNNEQVRVPGGYMQPPPVIQARPPVQVQPHGYLPPSGQGGPQKPIGNDYIINLRPPVPTGGYAPQPSNHQVQQQQQYGAPQQQSASSQVPTEVKQAQVQGNAEYSQQSSVVPVPVPTPIPREAEQKPKDVPVSAQTNQVLVSSDQGKGQPVTFSPPKGIVKNPHIQSIENSPPPTPTQATGTTATPSAQESGWEIIPAVQTDITHLFQSTKPTDQPKHVVPLPVPIPIPESQASKNPVFVVRNHGSQGPLPSDAPVQANIVVQGITYHEEQKLKNTQSPVSVAQSQAQNTVVNSPSPTPTQVSYKQQQNQVQSQSVGQGPVAVPVVFRPHPVGPFDPLPASISTALYHAQRTSYLTHQYLNSQNNIANSGRTVYVQSIPVQPQAHHQVSNSLVEGSSDSVGVTSFGPPDAIEEKPAPVIQDGKLVEDQTTPNCQNHPQWVKAEGQQVTPQVQQQQPYLMMYPTPVQPSPIYWVQPPRSNTNQGGVLQLTPHIQTSATTVGKPVYQWGLDSSQQQQELDSDVASNPSPSEEQQTVSTQDKGRNEEHYSVNIPFGQKLARRPTVTPFDIISIGNKDDAQVQSLESDSQPQLNAGSQPYQPQEPDQSSYEGVSQEEQYSGGQEDVRNQYEGQERVPTTAYVRPVSTTIIHSPESSSSYSSQTDSFRPQKVIVHDFTKSGGSESLQPFQEKEGAQEQGELGQQSQTIHSWDSRPKSPKFVEQYQENDEEEEDRQSLASIPIPSRKIVQYHQPIVTGSVSTSDCATAQNQAQTDAYAVPASFSSEEKVVPVGSGSEKIKYRLITRFPAGRPSLTAFSPSVPTNNPESSASISIPVYQSVSNGNGFYPSPKWSPPKNVILDDIYQDVNVSPYVENAGISETTEETPIVTEEPISMSTEKSATFSVSVDSGKSPLFEPTARKVPTGNDGQKLEIRFSPSLDQTEKSVFIVTSAPVPTTTTDPESSIPTTTPSIGSTSTKVVKTVRVRQRMRTGVFGHKHRFNGNGRVRVVHRTSNPDYVKHFPELVTPETDKLGQQEEEEVKNALIELQRTERAKN